MGQRGLKDCCARPGVTRGRERGAVPFAAGGNFVYPAPDRALCPPRNRKPDMLNAEIAERRKTSIARGVGMQTQVYVDRALNAEVPRLQPAVCRE